MYITCLSAIISHLAEPNLMSFWEKYTGDGFSIQPTSKKQNILNLIPMFDPTSKTYYVSIPRYY